MPAVTADTMTLPRVDAPDPNGRSRPVRTVTTAPRGFHSTRPWPTTSSMVNRPRRGPMTR